MREKFDRAFKGLEDHKAPGTDNNSLQNFKDICKANVALFGMIKKMYTKGEIPQGFKLTHDMISQDQPPYRNVRNIEL